MANSILTNVSAAEALQALNAGSAALTRTNNEISTGLAVAGARDDPATYEIAQNLRGQNAAWGGVSDSLGRAQSTLDVALAGSQQISDLLTQLKAKATAYADPSMSAIDRAAVKTDAQALIGQVDEAANQSSFDGVGLLAGQGVPAIVARTGSQSAVAYTSALTPQSFTTFMGAVSSDTAVSQSMMSTTSYSLPYSPLTPGSFALALPSLHSLSGATFAALDRTTESGGGSIELQFGGEAPGAAPVTTGVTLDAYTDPASFTVSQGGAVLATTPGPASAGRRSLSYTFDPSGGPVTVSSSSTAPWSVLGGSGDPSVSVSSYGGGQASDGQPLTLGTAGTAPTQGVQSLSVDGGSQPGRVDMLFDASIDPSTVDIYQNGVRVAATGQPYTPGGAAVGPGVPATGQSVLSFDYDPSKGTNLSFDVNAGTANAAAGWTVGALSLAPPGSPLPSGQTPTRTTEAQSTRVDETGVDYTGTPPPLTPELGAANSGSKTYTLAGGTNAGHVQLAIDAYDSPDTVEIYQNDVRVAASGQAVASNGAAVAAGQPVSGEQTLGFDYDPAKGQTLTVQVTQADSQAADGWLVQAMTLQTPSDEPSSTTVNPLTPQNTYGRAPYAFTKAPDGSQYSVESRNLTAVGLGLSPIDWSDPDAILQAVQQALATTNAAAQYYGDQANAVGGLMSQASGRRDNLTTGIGALVDADMASASAAQQAEQVRQQLATQTLSLANAGPSNLLSLFRG